MGRQRALGAGYWRDGVGVAAGQAQAWAGLGRSHGATTAAWSHKLRVALAVAQDRLPRASSPPSPEEGGVRGGAVVVRHALGGAGAAHLRGGAASAGRVHARCVSLVPSCAN